MEIQKVLEGLDRLFEKRQSGQVEEYLSGYLEQALQEKDAGSAITIINELIGFYRDTSQYDKARKYCQSLPAFLERVGLKDTIHYATSCLNIANAYRAAGEYALSLSFYEQVKKLYERLLEPEDFRNASLRNNLSLLYQEMGEYDKACEALEQALTIVSRYPEACIELAVTYSNLADSYLLAGRTEQAQQALDKALAIFEDGRTGDYHYSAAVAVAGDLCYAQGQYEQAAKQYEQAMLSLRSHVGMTHAYFRIVDKLGAAWKAAGREHALRGMTLAKEYYRQYGKPMLEDWMREHPGVQDLAVGKIGEGSECFGYDDLFSMDHDFEPGFCMFLTRTQYAEYGEELSAMYRSLPDTFHGFLTHTGSRASQRQGVICIEDFFERILNLDAPETAYLMEHGSLPETVWLRIEDWRLATVTNGALFTGEDTVFGRIYTGLKKGYPDKIRRRKLAQAMALASQTGQYNYERMMKRGDRDAAVYMLQLFKEQILAILFYHNQRYAPHAKWLMRAAGELTEGQNVYGSLQILDSMPVELTSYKERDAVDWIGSRNEKDPVIQQVDRIARDVLELLHVDCTKGQSVYLEDYITDITGKDIQI